MQVVSMEEMAMMKKNKPHTLFSFVPIIIYLFINICLGLATISRGTTKTATTTEYHTSKREEKKNKKSRKY